MSALESLSTAATSPVAAWTTRELDIYVGGNPDAKNPRGFSNPSKMPGYSYGLPAEDCRVGAKLRAVKGSTCAGCYAHKGSYVWPDVAAAYRRRADSLERPYWVEAMAELITRRSRKVPYFRWHDSGDLQSVEHLERICRVCALTPDVSHWLPTREYRMVTDYVEAGGVIPPNLNIRLSAHMIGGHVPTFPRLHGLVTVSTVSSEPGTYADASECPARFQENKCGDCRACFDTNVAHVDYHLH